MLGVSFLTPLDALFVLAGAVPVATLLASRRRASQIRRLLGAIGSRPRAALPALVALVLLAALVAVAAAQPVVIRNRMVSERADAQAFVLFDTSLSMTAAAPGRPTRLARAKQLAIRLQQALPDLPMGVASMTDRSLPNLLPTTDGTLFDRTVDQAVAVDEPPPSQVYSDRATTFAALVPLTESHFYSQGVQRRLLIVLTDGESSQVSPLLNLTLHRRVPTVLVHVWAPGERIFSSRGRPDPKYVSDPRSWNALNALASATGSSRAFDEHDVGAIVQAARDVVGRASTRTHIAAYARIPLAPWFVLGGILPLAFLLWRRNA